MMTGTAWAQAAGGPPGSPLVNMLPLVLIFVVFYFLLIRPQNQKAKEHKAMLNNLKLNDEVITSGGLYGRVVALSERIVTVELAPNVRVRVDRPQIANLVSEPKKSANEAKEKEKEKQK